MTPRLRFKFLVLAAIMLCAGFSASMPVFAQSALITEFRTRGAGSKFDEFIEIYNNTDSPLTVDSADNSGWAIAALSVNGNGVDTVAIIPEGTIIPARGHYLAANNGFNQNSYGLTDYATTDIDYGTDIRDNGGVALFNTATAANFTLANRLDAVGFASASGTKASLFIEGTGLAGNFGNSDGGQYSWVRKQAPNPAYPATSVSPYLNAAQDTGNNINDFIFVSETGGIFGGVQSKLGFPGPEGLTSPLGKSHDLEFTDSLADPTIDVNSSPNRVRVLRADCLDCNNDSSNLGKLFFRRKWTNQMSQCVTELRWRTIEITTAPVPVGTADLRVLSTTQVLPPSDCLSCNGAQVDKASATKGGGWNTSAHHGGSAGVIDLSTNPIPPGGQILTNFGYGVMQTGSYRVFINVEAKTKAPDPITGSCVPTAAPDIIILPEEPAATTTRKKR